MAEESATSDLVDLWRLAIEASNRRDIDAIMSLSASDVVYDLWARGLGVFEGKAAVRGYVADWFAAFDDLVFEVEEIALLGNGVVCVVINQHGRLHDGAALPVHAREGWVGAHAADGLLQLFLGYGDVDEARAAAERLAEERG
jgi:ketosteroid isomerase-like protein